VNVSFRDIEKVDLAFMLFDRGEPISYGSYSSYGIRIHEPTDVLALGNKEYAVQDTVLTMTIATGSLGTLVNNTNITVDGDIYQIHKFLLVSDGLETKLWLFHV
jgi:hypothetical protein